MLELVDKDVETAITNILHMFKSMMRKWMENILKIPDWTLRDEKYNIWDEKYTEWDYKLQVIRLVHFKDIAIETIQK